MSLEEREFIDADRVPTEAKNHKLGVFLSFVTTNDPHSPVMLPVYDKLVAYAEDQIPMYLVDCRNPINHQLVQDQRVYSVPTLTWVQYDWPTPLFRLVGTVMYKKLTDEFDKALELALA